jgi:hypothetical protein
MFFAKTNQIKSNFMSTSFKILANIELLQISNVGWYNDKISFQIEFNCWYIHVSNMCKN